MSQDERWGKRDLTYSRWHRSPNLPNDCTYCDVDGMEYCAVCKEPLVLVETAVDIRQDDKDTRPMERLAERANLPAWLVLYKKSDESDQATVIALRVKKISPRKSEWYHFTPEQWREEIIKKHREHVC